MNNKEFRIGITVFGALTALVLLTIVFGKAPSMNFGTDTIVKVRFERAPGITRKSPVYKNGVRIGEVINVKLIEEDRAVEVSMRVPPTRKIYTDEVCRIHQTMIMGDASLELVKNTRFQGEVKPIDPDVPMLGEDTPDIISGLSDIEGDLLKAINNVSEAAAQFNTVSEKIGSFVEKANGILGSEDELNRRKVQFDTLLTDIDETMKSFRTMSNGVNQLVGDPKVQESIRSVIETMPAVMEQSKTLVKETNAFIQEARALAERGGKSFDKVEAGFDRATAALESIKKITDSIEGDVPEIVDSLKKSSAKLGSFFDEITTLVSSINNSDGSIMKLFREPEFYDKLMSTLDNVEQLTGEVNRVLQQDVKPITDNVRILTDKAARDPSIFIRNLIRRQPRTKNLPYWGDGLGSDGVCYCNETEIKMPATPLRYEVPMQDEYQSEYEEMPLTFVPPSEAMDVSADEGRIVNIDPRYKGGKKIQQAVYRP